MQLLRLRAPVVAALLLSALAARPVRAQFSDPHPPLDPRNAVVPTLQAPADITAAFLVHPGDDPAYASPAFDDSAWPTLDTSNSLVSIGIVRQDFVWYRLHLHIPPHSRSLALLFRGFTGSQQIFVNGVLTGPNRSFASGGSTNPNFDLTAPIPDSLLQSGNIVIAIRACIHNGRYSLSAQPGFSARSLLLLGDSGVIESRLSLDAFYNYASNFADLVFTAFTLAITLALWFALRKEREYLYLAVYLAGSVLSDAVNILQSRYDINLSSTAIVLLTALYILTMLAGLEFARIVLRLPPRRWIVAYEATIAFLILLSGIQNLYFAHFGAPPLPVLWASLALYALAAGSLGIGIPFVALFVWRRTRNFDALLFSIPILARGLIFYLYLGYDVFCIFRYGAVRQLPSPPLGNFGVSWGEIADFIFLLALLLFLILRTVRIARARAALAAEIAAAQSVQQLLLARAAHPTPGFLLDVVYHPASEVGGDFFLILPSTEDASLIVVVGDVSGKGLGAAMRVAMILGALSREASRSPAQVLANLNQTLFAQAAEPTQLGFTTAACLHLTAAGDYTLANAGHLSPYLAQAHTSRELHTTPALPLGLTPQQAYPVVTGRLAPGQRLIFLSDGVPEARNHHGTLLGFDRLPELTRQTPVEIAATAQTFGQEDDITVLSIALA